MVNFLNTMILETSAKIFTISRKLFFRIEYKPLHMKPKFSTKNKDENAPFLCNVIIWYLRTRKVFSFKCTQHFCTFRKGISISCFYVSMWPFSNVKLKVKWIWWKIFFYSFHCMQKQSTQIKGNPKPLSKLCFNAINTLKKNIMTL